MKKARRRKTGCGGRKEANMTENNRKLYIADTHFGHKNCIEFDNRPFSSVDEMEEIMCMNWNYVVRAEDTVYILGDFCFQVQGEWLRILKLLNGQKILIRGNHDPRELHPAVAEQFARVENYLEVADGDRRVILSHYPILCYKNAMHENCYMLYGHVHRTKDYDDVLRWTKEIKEERANPWENRGQLYNVGCMLPYMYYTPRTLDQIIDGCTEE